MQKLLRNAVWCMTEMSDTRRYLVVGPSWVGDMVMAQSLFISLRQNFPACEIDVLAPAWSLPVLQRMPEVRQGIEDKTGHGEFGFFKRWQQGRRLRANAYTHAIVLPRSWKSALVPFVANVPQRTGYKGEQRFGLLNDMRALDKTLLTQTVQRYVALGEARTPTVAPTIPVPRLRVDVENRDKLLSHLKLVIDKPVICMMPGAEYGPAKQWPLAYFTELALQLVAAGYRVWVLGSDKEAEQGDVIAKNHEDIISLCGRTRLVDVIDLIACAEQVVSNDSGLMHIAAATGVRVNAIYGSSTPLYTPPLTLSESQKIFYRALPCSPCFQRVCPLGHTNCLNEIKPQMVLDEILH